MKWLLLIFGLCGTACLSARPLIAAPPNGELDRRAIGASEGSLSRAELQLELDIDRSRLDLAELHEAVSLERAELALGVERLLREVEALESELSRGREREASLETDLEQIQRESAFLDEVIVFIDGLSREYRRAFETRIHVAEFQRYEHRLAEVDGALKGDTPIDRLKAIPLLLEIASSHMDAHVGGDAFPGTALDMSGNVHEGSFALAGPVGYFASRDSGVAGVVIQQLGSLNPTVFGVPGPVGAPEAIRSLMEGEEASVPVDITLGSAVKLRHADESLLEHARKGGITMIPLLVLAAACLLLGLYKFVSLHMIRTRGSEGKIMRVLSAIKENRPEAAQELARKLPRPIGPVIREGVRYREAPKEQLEEILTERILAQAPGIDRLLTPLAVCASAAPLLGLLGTVTGMMHTFKLITIFGTGDATRLSSGISEALVTTEFGLMIAIPALLIHAYLSRRARKAVTHAQQSALIFVNALKLK
jgi:biopolymer transport protein ExbB